MKALIISFALLGCISCKETTEQTTPEFSVDLNKVRLADLQNKPIPMRQFSGKTVFINFWSTWCKPCRQEMPSISRMIKKVNNPDIVYLFASEESAAEIQEFAHQNDFLFQYVRLMNSADLNIITLPTTFIFNSSGILVYQESGYRDWDKPESIELLLNITK